MIGYGHSPRFWRIAARRRFMDDRCPVRAVELFLPTTTSAALDRSVNRQVGSTFSAWSAAGSGKISGPGVDSSRPYNTQKMINTPGGAEPKVIASFIALNPS